MSRHPYEGGLHSAIKAAHRETRMLAVAAGVMMAVLAGGISWTLVSLSSTSDRVTKIERFVCVEKPYSRQCSVVRMRIARAQAQVCRRHPASRACERRIRYACSTTRLAGYDCPALAGAKQAGLARSRRRAGRSDSPDAAPANSASPAVTAPSPTTSPPPQAPTASPPDRPSGGNGGGPLPWAPGPDPNPPPPPTPKPPPADPLDPVTNPVCDLTQGIGLPVCL